MRPSAVAVSGLTVGAFARTVIRFRYAVIAVCVAVALAMAAGIAQLDFSTDYRVFFGAANPHLAAHNANQAAYQKEDGILLVLAPQRGTIFTPEILIAVRDLTRESWQLPYATRVDSITNFQHSEARGDDIVIRPLAADGTAIDAGAAARLRDIVLAEPSLLGRLVARDEAATGIHVALTLPGQDTGEVPQAMRAVRALADSFRAEHPGIRVAITGTVPLNNAFVEAALHDAQRLFPAVYGVVFLAVLLIFPSLAAVVGMFAVVALSMAGALGAAGWGGLLLNPVSAAAPLIITTVATADVVHILTSMNSRMRQGTPKIDAIVEALEINFVPVLMTSLTTAIGFLSLNASDAPPFHDLGNIAALGVVLAWILSIALLPALLAALPVGRSAFLDRFQFLSNGFSAFVIARPRPVLLATAVATALLVACIPRITLNDQFVEYFSSDIPFRADTEFAARRLTGVYRLEFSVDAGGSGAVAEPDYLARLDRFAGWLRAQPEVAHVAALPDTFKRLNRTMHGDDPSQYRLPASRELAAQYLLLFEMSLPQGKDLRNQINVDRSASHVVATLHNITTRQTQLLKERAEAWLQANFPTAAGARATGPAVMFSYISETNIRSMLKGTGVALILISLCLIVMLRNARLGVISLLPNVIPVLMALGAWGLVVGRVGLAASVVAAVTLGIVVDNTVHFLSKYQWAARRGGVSSEAAVRSAFAVVGPALLSTTAILLCGFLVLAFSSFQANANLGLLTALTIFFALLTDILMLPALLITSGGGTGDSR
jgi:predicted RND superfamily exporter protein